MIEVFVALSLADSALGAGERAVDFLWRNIPPSGQVPSFWFRDTAGFTDAKPEETGFGNSFLLNALRFVPVSPEGDSLAGAAASFLVKWQEPGGVFRYWHTNPILEGNPESELGPDLDDVSCISYELFRLGMAVEDNTWLVDSLRAEGGGFWTWLAPPGGHENEVDFVVNCNLARYLWALGRPDPGLCDYLASQLDDPVNNYYPEESMIPYAASRALRDGVACLEPLRGRLIGRAISGREDDGLALALDANTLLNCGYQGPELDRKMRLLLACQDTDGGFPITNFFSAPGQVLPHFGSREITTCIAAEALFRYAGGR